MTPPPVMTGDTPLVKLCGRQKVGGENWGKETEKEKGRWLGQVVYIE